MADQPKSVDEYIASRSVDVQVILHEIRRAISKALPGYGDKMSYQMPTVTLNGQALMYFAAWKKHIGIYPIPTLDGALEHRISPYRSGKDSVKFPLREPIPYDLIVQVVEVLRQRSGPAERSPQAP